MVSRLSLRNGICLERRFNERNRKDELFISFKETGIGTTFHLYINFVQKKGEIHIISIDDNCKIC